MKGIYVLVLSIKENICINVGSLDKIFFEKGLYAYVGSAQTSFEKRIQRHIRKNKKRFWHIDYLLESKLVDVMRVFYKEAARKEECEIAKQISSKGSPMVGFGSSDCKCKSHLFKVSEYTFLRKFMCEMSLEYGKGEPLMLKAGWCVWITGLPGSGKSVVSDALLKLLKQKDIHAQLLSSDALRKVLTPKPSYSLEERDMVYEMLVYVAKLLTQNGTNVVIDATGNLRRYRENARQTISRFIEVYLKCPLNVCMKREANRGKTFEAPKQIYDRAKKGVATTVPGVGQPYEAPKNPEIAIDTTKSVPKECAKKILEEILRFEREED
jgi:adenylylsulfate kinase